MEMTINVKVDVSERVVALVERLLAGMTPQKAAEVAAVTATPTQAAEVTAVTATPTQAAEVTSVTATPTEAVETPKINVEPEAEAAKAAPNKGADTAVQAPTAEDVRQAMVETRKRIIGDGWDDPESDSYKFYHRTLVSMFKTTATLHGAPKPSQLAEDERQAFIDDLAKICKDERGKLTNGQEVPF